MLRKYIQGAIDKIECSYKSIPIGHGFSFDLVMMDGEFSIELGVDYPHPWGGEPIKRYVGGVSIAPGKFAILDQSRDAVFCWGKNLLKNFYYLGDTRI